MGKTPAKAAEPGTAPTADDIKDAEAVSPTDAPDSTTPQSPASTDLAGKSALEVLAQAGDEAARQALGLPTAAGAALANELRDKGSSAGFELGKAAPKDVYVDLDGKVTDPSGGQDGFRGSQIAVKGAVVDASTLSNLRAAGVI